ncbi:uncharacterized protein LOC126677318 isoform X2 [Mercurialis annua]|uniref:uncharacterized protein LOC126677318 isoform X2 n=1 Tax=Mercurialis annua TaxID=3986 RepID=UPI00215E549C|nr:uncharacterized protein LOC126677318 isoform X2 [Mercurialis annua]
MRRISKPHETDEHVRRLIFCGTQLSIYIRFYIFIAHRVFHLELGANELTLYAKFIRSNPILFITFICLVLLVIPALLSNYFWETGPIRKNIVVGNLQKCKMLGLSLFVVVIGRLLTEEISDSYCIIILTIEFQGYKNLLLSSKDYGLWDIIVVVSLQILVINLMKGGSWLICYIVSVFLVLVCDCLGGYLSLLPSCFPRNAADIMQVFFFIFIFFVSSYEVVSFLYF